MMLKIRFPLLFPAILALFGGIWIGLSRAGRSIPLPSPIQSSLHGPLMVGGFLGTLVSPERAVKLPRPVPPN